jgi:hypothetical protein
MIAIIDEATGAIERIALTTDGLDLAGKVTMPTPEGYDAMQPSHILADGEWLTNVSFHKRRLTDAVNAHAETVRNLFLTPGSGQAITYARKEAEARAWTEEADPADFPFLSAEATATGATLADTAALVLAQANAWVTIGAAIEGNRRGLVVAIDVAADVDALNEIDTAAGWPSA